MTHHPPDHERPDRARQPARGRREPLDTERIVTAAIALADADGVGALSMRKLARRLGFEAMSLYNHVANKDELLRLMLDAVAAEIPDPDPDAAPLAAVRAVAVETRAALVRHPWAAGEWLRYVPGPARSRQMEVLLGLFDRSGIAPDLAHHGYHAVTNHVLGYTLQEIGMALGADDDVEAAAHDFLAGLEPERFPHTIAHVHEHLEGRTSSSFELVLDLILDGLVRLDDERGAADRP